MSESTFPLSAGEPPDDEVRPAHRRRTLLAIGGAGVVALAAVGVLALTGPGEEELDLGLPSGTPAAAATPSPSASPPAPAEVTTEVRRGRDPFRAPTGAGGSTTATAGSPTSAGDGSTGVAPPATAPVAAAPQEGIAAPVGAPAAGTGTDPVPGSEPGAARRLSLVRVAADQTAVLALDGAPSTVRVGEAFGPGGSLLLLSLQQGPDDGQWTAVVQQGSGDPFDVVTGHPATLA